ncbi:MAG: acyl-CoA thioesterase [Polyangiaceae bacterium]|jgi:acyl-CoA thioesterase FadM|nr:acyl-CoA thioesterase [Polyangiaceae bacterium]
MNEPALHDHVSVVRPRPNDYDWALQLNNSVFVELFEAGRWDWSLANGIDLRSGPLVGAVARLEVDYKKPVFWDPSIALHVTTSLVRLERFSLYLRQRVALAGDEVADGLLRLVVFDKDKRAMVPVELGRLRGASC